MARRGFLFSVPVLPSLLGADTEPGFTSLFNGRTLAGWRIREGPESAFYVRDGAIVIHEGSNYPTWLSTQRQYENFDFRCEFFLRGWSDSGVYIHAPEHGRNSQAGLKVNVFHRQDKVPTPESMGSIFPLIAPLEVNVKNQGEWNRMRILSDWPELKVWINDSLVQDLNLQRLPELRHRLRQGYIGLESLSYPVRFRNLRIRELPSKEVWETLYDSPEDMAKWFPLQKAKWDALGHVLRGDGLGYLATRESYADFELQLYVRPSKHSNGGVMFRASGEDPSKSRYEIQVHDVEEAAFPTGSLYGYKRAVYPRIEPERWFLFQLIVKRRACLVRINGETVVDYRELEHLEPGPIMLQAHQAGRWIEYKHIRVKRL